MRCLARISSSKNELITPDEYQSETYFEEIAGRVYVRYQEALRANNAMDFDDSADEDDAAAARQPGDCCTSISRSGLTCSSMNFRTPTRRSLNCWPYLAGPPNSKRNLFVVGDEDQSIYRFRGADYRNVMRFRDDYPDAKVILLEQNYRSTQTILDVANSVISNNRSRTPKTLFTDNGKGLEVTVYEGYNEIEEAAFVCDEIERLVGSRAFGLGDFALMYRTNAQSRALEEAMVLRNMKYKLGRRHPLLRAQGDQGRAGLSAPGPQSAGQRGHGSYHQRAGTWHRRQDLCRAQGLGAGRWDAGEYRRCRFCTMVRNRSANRWATRLPDDAYSAPLAKRAQNALVGFCRPT